MQRHEIQSLVNALDYDLDTIWHLIDYGRAYDSMHIMVRVLNRIQSLQAHRDEGPYDLNQIFPVSFWEQDIREGLKTKELRSKIIELSRKSETGIENDFEKKDYVRFFWLLRSWVSDNNELLKNRIKSPQQRKMETLFLGLILGVIAIGLVCLLMNYISIQNKGLQGDFYQGANFDRHVWAEKGKAIDYFSCEAMDSHATMPTFTARWQGKLLVPQDGNYVFIVDVDDGARLFIDNQRILDSWRVQPVTESKNGLFLKKGPHLFRFEYVNFTGDCTVRLFWQGPGFDKEIISDRYLRIR